MKNLINGLNATTRFCLRDSYKTLESTPEKVSTIILHISINGKKINMSTGYQCSLNQWDRHRQRIKTGKARISNAHEINKFLSDLERKAHSIYNDMVINHNSVNLKVLKEEIQNYIKGITTDYGSEKESVIAYTKVFIDSRKSRVTNSTVRNYKQLLNLLVNYEKNNGTTLTFDDIDTLFYGKFLSYLEKSNFSKNTIGKHIKSLKAVMNDADTNGYTSKKTFKKFKPLKEITTQIYLDDNEIKSIQKLDLSKEPKMNRARDIFLIGYFTGQRVSDYNGLTEDNITEDIHGNKYITIKQKKTNIIVDIPLTSEIKEIRKKHNGFPKRMEESVLRKELKKIAKKAGINTPVERFYTKGGKKIKKITPKYQLVSTHTSRRSFCTNLRSKGGNVQDIMHITGHQSESNFYNYIRENSKTTSRRIYESGLLSHN